MADYSWFLASASVAAATHTLAPSTGSDEFGFGMSSISGDGSDYQAQYWWNLPDGRGQSITPGSALSGCSSFSTSLPSPNPQFDRSGVAFDQWDGDTVVAPDVPLYPNPLKTTSMTAKRNMSPDIQPAPEKQRKTSTSPTSGKTESKPRKKTKAARPEAATSNNPAPTDVPKITKTAPTTGKRRGRPPGSTKKREGGAAKNNTSSMTIPTQTTTATTTSGATRHPPNAKAASPAMAAAPLGEGEGGEDYGDDGVGRLQALARNRLAANKCRLKKKDEADKLAAEERAMEAQCSALSAYATQLREEVFALKSELFRHVGCGCVLIQQYIADSARRQVLEHAGGCDGTKHHRTADWLPAGAVRSANSATGAGSSCLPSPVGGASAAGELCADVFPSPGGSRGPSGYDEIDFDGADGSAMDLGMEIGGF